MNETFIVKVMGEDHEISKGTTYYELSKLFKDKFKYPIIAAKVEGQFKFLNREISGPREIEFYDLTTRLSNKIYVSGLILLTVTAIHELYGESHNIKVRHSIDKGLYIETTFPIDEQKLAEIKVRMLSLIEKDIAINKCNVSRMEALNYYTKKGDLAKVGLLNYTTNNYITLYKLNNEYNYFFTKMPASTGALGYFELTYLNDHGYVLSFPTAYTKELLEYKHHPQMFDVFSEYHEWAKIMNIENLSSLNKVVSDGRIGDLIRIDETLQANRLLNIAREIYEKKDKVKVVLMAGPSSSGKTTTCNKLAMYLRSFGLKPINISMDDYFVDRDKTPVDENGEPDFESLYTLNLELFDDHVKRLLNGEEVVTPKFDFIDGKSVQGHRLKLPDDGILLFEGIHGLNPELFKSIPRNNKYKIYISPLTVLNIDNHNKLATTDNRLLRRIVRDNRTRGYNVDHTLATWPKVRLGEEKNIFPWQDEADCTFNTALIYELGVLKTYVEPLLYSVEPTSIHYEEARSLLNMLKTFLPIPSEDIPDDSILREFVGGSCFKI